MLKYYHPKSSYNIIDEEETKECRFYWRRKVEECMQKE